MNIVGSESLSLQEVTDAMNIVHDVAHEDANIIFGTALDETLGDAVRVTVIAAGFERWENEGRPAAAPVRETTSAPTTTADIFKNLDNDDFLTGGEDDIPDFLK